MIGLNGSHPIRVLHITDKFSLDGKHPMSPTLLMGEWLPRFDPAHVNASVATLRDPDPTGSYLEERGIRVHYIAGGKYDPIDLVGILRLIDREEPDVLHTHGWSSSNYGRIAALSRGLPIVVHEHAAAGAPPQQLIADYLLRNLTGCGVAVSEASRRFMIRRRSVPARRVRVVPNAVDLSRFENIPAGADAAMIARLGLPPGAVVIGAVTHFRAEKGNDILLRAFRQIQPAALNAWLVLVGDGPDFAALERLAARLGVADRVLFPGFRDDVPDVLGALSIFALPSLTEGMPLALIEAMAAARPILATAVGGVPEVGVDGETMLIVPPADPETMADRLLRLIRDPDEAAALARRARTASRAYDIRNTVTELESIYRELTAARRESTAFHRESVAGGGAF